MDNVPAHLITMSTMKATVEFVDIGQRADAQTRSKDAWFNGLVIASTFLSNFAQLTLNP